MPITQYWSLPLTLIPLVNVVVHQFNLLHALQEDFAVCVLEYCHNLAICSWNTFLKCTLTVILGMPCLHRNSQSCFQLCGDKLLILPQKIGATLLFFNFLHAWVNLRKYLSVSLFPCFVVELPTRLKYSSNLHSSCLKIPLFHYASLILLIISLYN